MLMVDGRYDLLSEQLHLVGLLVFCVGGKLSPSGSSLLSRELKCVYRIFWTLSWLITKKKWKGSKVLIYLISTWSGCSCRMQDSLFPLGGPEHRERTVCWGGFGQSSSPSASSLLVPQIDPSVPQPVVQSRRRPLLGPSPGWKRLLPLSHLRHY